MNTKLSAQVNDFYDKLEFPGRYTSFDLDQYNDEIHNTYLKFIDKHLRDGLEVLDVGCGTGLITNIFANRYKSNFTAIDFSKGVLYGKEYAKTNNISNTQWIHQNFLNYKTDIKYDLIICQGVLHHIPEYKDALVIMKNLLKPGGTLLLGVYHPVGKLVQQFFKIQFFNELLKTDQLDNPFELSFTLNQVENMCHPLVLESHAPKLLSRVTSLKFVQSGGLVIYSLRNQL